ncbi:MAG TPA: DUF3298 domain-containing protein [Haliscomenobacter sp.]|uniref:DUF3298 and DUF4163 domain-containing protein n=1 Tax=Haliscomenobacter sp. TaxID=2717303 RepID=UPI002BD75CE0|nr:DUF3298 domain-containing protein [Haliscomenobacter sp.]HOY19980.1 DUF3298 domain-containing protein [Haliscomenobacter sp.]
MKKLFFALLLCTAVCACEQKESSVDEKMPDAKDYAYLHLIGTIGDAPIHMNLIQDLDYDKNPWYTGYYTYDEIQEPLGFYSSMDSTGQGQLILTEFAVADEPYGLFKGKLEKGVFSGEYTSAAGKKSPFTLTYSFPEGTQQFSAVRIEATEPAKKDAKDSPKGHFAYEYFTPKATWLKDAFLKEMVGDSLAQVYKNPEKAYVVEQKKFFVDYHAEVEGMMEDDQDAAFLNYDFEKSMEVLFNQDNLLSIATVDYSYAGGAHGNYGSACASFDLEKKKKISLEDVFKPNYEATLTQALTAAAKKKFNVQDLEEVLFVKEVEPNGNFFLTGKGICFNYVPYEIGAYAAGELKFFVPFTELKTVLK